MAVSIVRLETVQFSNADETVSTGVDVTIRLTEPELAALVAEYNEASPSTPTAATCRAIARPIAAAIVAE